MSNFDNGGLGDGGLQAANEKQYAGQRVKKRLYTPRTYKETLTYEELKQKIEEFFAETPLPETKIDLWVSSPKGWIRYEDSPQFHEAMKKEALKWQIVDGKFKRIEDEERDS